MTTLDWIILVVAMVSIVVYGVWKGRGQKDLKAYLLANRNMKWYTIALSIMATQASAITFLSTPGQAYAEGMGFLQMYLGLPIAMVILSITAVPLYHRLKVFTAYEYLEGRFDLKTRSIAALLFLTQRGLAAGLTIYAPALVLSLILGWDLTYTILVVGVIAAVRLALARTDEATQVIPGHGPLADRSDLEAYLEMLELVRERVTQALGEGQSEEEIMEARLTSDLDPSWGGNAEGGQSLVRVALKSLEGGGATSK